MKIKLITILFIAFVNSGFAQLTYDNALLKSEAVLIKFFNQKNYNSQLKLIKDSTKCSLFKKAENSGWNGSKEYYYEKNKKKKADEFTFYYKYINDFDSSLFVLVSVSKDTSVIALGLIDINEYNGVCKLKISKDSAISLIKNKYKNLINEYCCVKLDWLEYGEENNIKFEDKKTCSYFCPFRGNVFKVNPTPYGRYVWLIDLILKTEEKLIIIDVINGKFIKD